MKSNNCKLFLLGINNRCYNCLQIIIIILNLLLRSFYISVSRWALNGVLVTTCLLRYPGLSLGNTLVWIVSSLPLISNPPRFDFKTLGTVSSATTTIVIICHDTLIVWQKLNSCLSFCFLLFSLCCLLERQNTQEGKPFFLETKTKSGPLAGIEWSFCNLKS